MKARGYEYFISYRWYKWNENGFGNVLLVFKKKASAKSLLKAAEYLEGEYGFEKVIIQNYQLLRERRAL